MGATKMNGMRDGLTRDMGVESVKSSSSHPPNQKLLSTPLICDDLLIDLCEKEQDLSLKMLLKKRRSYAKNQKKEKKPTSHT